MTTQDQQTKPEETPRPVDEGQGGEGAPAPQPAPIDGETPAPEPVAAKKAAPSAEELAQDYEDNDPVEAMVRKRDAAKAPPAPEQAPAQEPEKTFNVVIDGRSETLTEKQMIERVQKSGAADHRLQQATQLLEEARKATPSGALPPSQPAATPQPRTEPTPAADDDKSLADLVEKLQLGTPEEALPLLKQALRGQNAPVDTAALATQVRAENLKTEALSVPTQFFADANNADLTDPTLKGRTAEAYFRGMAQDLVEAGATKDQMATITSYDQLALVHATLRLSGLGRDPREIMKGASDDTRGWLSGLAKAAPQPTGLSLDRQERKNSVQVQPSSRSAPPPPLNPAPETLEASRRRAVAEERGSMPWLRAS
jgi:hypothetical protein